MLNEFEPLETLHKKFMHGLDYVNLIILDAGLGVHIGVWNKKENSFTNFHTQQKIDTPLMWCSIPNMNEGLFDRLIDELE